MLQRGPPCQAHLQENRVSISAVITTHNRPQLVFRALSSVLAQRRAADEILLVDDGSDDNGAWWRAASFPEVRYHWQERRGISGARNLGIRRARSEWIAFLDDDDEWRPNKLAEQERHLRAHPQARVLHCDETWLRNGVPVTQKKRHHKPSGWIFRHCLPRCCISPSAVLIHRQVFADAGRFDDTLPVCEDYDMWLRLAARYPVHCVRQPLLIKHGGHAGQLSRTHWGMDRFRILALEKCLASGALDAADRAAAWGTLARKIDIYLKGARKHGQTRHVAHFTALLQEYGALTAGLE